MVKHVVITAAVFLAVVVVPSVAHAQSINSALTRMDEIIKQMEQLRAEFATLSAAVNGTGSSNAGTGAVLGASTKKYLTQDLSYGVTNSDIERIQKLFATDKEIYPYGVVSGFFGPKTQEAIRNFQTRFGMDPVGVVGPATTALLELFFNAYPDQNYPVGVLSKKPQVAGVSTSVPSTPTTPSVPSGTNPAKTITVQFDDGEALITITYTNGNRKGLITNTTDKAAVVAYIAKQTVLTTAQIEAVINYGRSSSSSSSSGDYDEDDANEALDDAEDELDDAADEIEEADDDGEDVDWADDTLDEAYDAFDDAEDAYDDEDWDKAVKYAKEAKSLAKKAADRIGEEEDDNDGDKGDSDEIESIEAEVEDGETHVTVEYEDDDDYEFDIDEDKEDNIIEAIAEELDIDEDDVEDLIEFDFGKISKIEATIKTSETLVIVYYKSGVDRRFHIDEDDEDDIIAEVADLLDEDEDDVEGWIGFTDKR